MKDDVFNRLVDLIRDGARHGGYPAHLADVAITPDTQLAALGIDSLGKMTLLSALMDITDSDLSEEVLDDRMRIRDIIEAAEKNAAQ